ncbi:MAG: hypothetical protein JSV80_15755, partial [Acidobacteriota bacterium]
MAHAVTMVLAGQRSTAVRRRSFLVLFFVILTLTLAARPTHGAGLLGNNARSRGDEPVLAYGSSFSAFQGRLLSDLALFRYDPDAVAFEPIPFQIDERIEKLFNEGLEFEFRETIYDVLGEDDGRLDADDELVFIYRDAGPRARAEAPWPECAEEIRYEIAAIDTRPGVSNPTGWVYLFAGTGLARSSEQRVSWDLLPSSAISSACIELGFTDRWLLTELRVFPPCGSGIDLI